MRKFLVCKCAVMVLLIVSNGVLAENADIDEEYVQVTGLIHMDSEVSGGDNSLAMLAAVAKNAGAEVGIVTDHDTQRVAYGIWPLKNILKVSYSRPSVRTYGIAKYLREIETVDSQTDDFTFLPGIEAVPYYRWERPTISRQLTLRNLHRHMLVFGLDTQSQLADLPSIEAGYPAQVTPAGLLPLVWLVPLIVSFFLFSISGADSFHETSLIVRVFSRPLNVVSIVIFVVSGLFLVNGYPYREQAVTQYGPEAGALPYQILIDYVNSHGGLTFWAHPEAAYYEKIDAEKGNPLVNALVKNAAHGGISVETDPYYHLLNDTRDYTGFAVFFEGKRIVGNPEGLWDDLLMQFVSGKRQRPIWAISEIDMEHGTDPETASAAQTVFLVKEKSTDDYLDALRVGRMYCFANHVNRWLTIRDYSVVSGDVCAISGEIIEYRDVAHVVFDADLRETHHTLEAVVISDGKVLDKKTFHESCRFTVPLPEPSEDMGYVRLVVNVNGNMSVVTNPIFLGRSIPE